MKELLPMLLVVYALPIVITAGLWGWRWWRAPEMASRWEPLMVTVPLLVGFCGLEGRWPWELHSPWRTHYWIPAGLLAFGVLPCVLRKSLSRSLGYCATGIAVIAVLLALLERYAFKLNEDWPPVQHGLLLAMLVLLGLSHVFGQMGLCRRLNAPWYLTGQGILLAGGIAYAIVGASSLKVGQWLSIGGVIVGVMALLSYGQKQRRVSVSIGALFGLFTSAALLYGFYAALEASLIPLVVLLVAPLTGLRWAFSAELGPLRSAQSKLAVGAIILAVIAALVLLFLVPSQSDDEEEEGDELDYYGLVDPVQAERISDRC